MRIAIIALSLLLLGGSAFAIGCTSQIITGPGGRTLTCISCCNSISGCSVNCY